MTKQYLVEKTHARIDGCEKCSHYERTDIFDLCKHSKSEYKTGTGIELHTCQHMRGYNYPCGTDMILFVKR